ncbi:MAG TPA: septum formation family protein [Nocardioides sp.]|nr:septum formation family protein [Nocardioides sp.]
MRATSRVVRVLTGCLAVALLAAGCTSPAPEPDGEPSPSTTSSPTGTEAATPAPDPGPTPRVGQCHALSFRQALAVVGRTEPVACRKRHTAQTYLVGRLRLRTPAGSTRRVDSDAAQRQARTTCLTRLPGHLGLTPRELRLTMARAVWFTPSQQRADAGAGWFRCDVVAVASPRQLLPLPRRTRGWGGAPAAAMCATAAPGTPAFRRVGCGTRHSWVAVATVDIPGRRLPPRAAIAERMESTCRDLARGRAQDPLDFTWSQESPTREQWAAGQRYGICWVPA